jgi:hypothetical protein
MPAPDSTIQSATLFFHIRLRDLTSHSDSCSKLQTAKTHHRRVLTV